MARSEVREAPSAKGERFSVFLKKPWAKACVCVLGALLVWWLAYPAVNVLEGSKAPASSVSGVYSSRDGSRISVGDGSGRYYLSDRTLDFSFSYDAGLLSCVSGSESFGLRYLSNGTLFDYPRHVYLVRVSQ